MDERPCSVCPLALPCHAGRLAIVRCRVCKQRFAVSVFETLSFHLPQGCPQGPVLSVGETWCTECTGGYDLSKPEELTRLREARATMRAVDKQWGIKT